MKLIDRTGQILKSANGTTVEVIKYINWRNCTIKFEDGTIVENVNYGRILYGGVKNKNDRTFSGVGYIGYGKFSMGDALSDFYLNTWSCMLKRCYRDDVHKRQPHYKACTVAEEWHNFQVFAQWMEDNYNPELMKNWHLDKDILVKGNKIYSPETCRLVPQEINIIFIKRQTTRSNLSPGVSRSKGGKFYAKTKFNGVKNWLGVYNTELEAFQAYKTAKEVYIKEVADKWKNLIDPRVYQALYNYKVEITD